MKTSLLGLTLASFTLLSATAQAGSLGEPILQEDVIVQDTTSSSAPGAAFVLALLTLAVVIAAAD